MNEREKWYTKYREFFIGLLAGVILVGIFLINLNSDFKSRMKEWEADKKEYEEKISQLQTENAQLLKDASVLSEKIAKEQQLIVNLEDQIQKLKENAQQDIDNVDDYTLSDLQQFFTNRYNR